MKSLQSDQFDVGEAYNSAASEYLAGRAEFDSSVQIRRITSFLPARASILDLGCGAGIPVARALAARQFEVTGVDISSTQVVLARKNVRQANFVCANFMELEPRRFSVDCVIAFYSLYHVPRSRHAEMYNLIASFLHPAGSRLFFALIGTKDWEGKKDNFYGTEMRWSSYSVEQELNLMEDAGFVVTNVQPDLAGGESHVAILARLVR